MQDVFSISVRMSPLLTTFSGGMIINTMVNLPNISNVLSGDGDGTQTYHQRRII